MSKRLNYIDALRGFAVLGVIAIHSAQASAPLNNILGSLLQQGKYGVQLFYVISAFTLFLSLSVRRSTESGGVRNFFIRRFFRIAPLFWCAIVFYWWRDGLGPRHWLGDAPGITSVQIVATAMFVNGWNPYWINSLVNGGWSVAIEMMFYLLVPFLFRIVRSLESAGVFVLVTLFLSLMLGKIGSFYIPITDRDLWFDFLYFWLPNQLPVFGLGFVLFFLSRRLDVALPQMNRRVEKSRLLLITSAFACFALTFGVYRLLPVHFLYGI